MTQTSEIDDANMRCCKLGMIARVHKTSALSMWRLAMTRLCNVIIFGLTDVPVCAYVCGGKPAPTVM